MKIDIFRYRTVLFVLIIVCLLEHMCYCLDIKQMNESVNHVLYHQNATPYYINVSGSLNTTQMAKLNHSVIHTLIYDTSRNYNISVLENKTDSGFKHSGDTQLPTIIIASPAVAVGIFIFICIAYKWHTVQLDSQAKELAAQVGSGYCPSNCIPCSPCHNSQRLLPPSDSITMNSSFLSESDLPGPRRKSLRTPSPILLSPPNLGSHRWSSWSALSDQEVISHSPRRHSTFLL